MAEELIEGKKVIIAGKEARLIRKDDVITLTQEGKVLYSGSASGYNKWAKRASKPKRKLQ